MTISPNIPADQYHRDEVADVPTLSASIAALMIEKSPAHAREAHPRLNPHFVREDKAHFDLGTCVHDILLEGIDRVEIIEADSWRTNAAKEARDIARADGKIPLLGKDYFDVLAMVNAARAQMEVHEADPPLLSEGKPEVTLTWEEDGVACRSRLDWLRDDLTVIDDIKTSGRSANPHDFARQLYSHGYDTKAAFYLRAVKALRGRPFGVTTFRWIVIEAAPPYALSVVTPGPDVLALADAKVDKALATWKACLSTGVWPAYDTRVATAELPAYEEIKWMERTAA